MNERIIAFLNTFYAATYPSGVRDNWVQMMNKYLAEEQTGDYNNRMRALLALV